MDRVHYIPSIVNGIAVRDQTEVELIKHGEAESSTESDVAIENKRGLFRLLVTGY